MAEDPEDPFEGLVLDEDFVRAATRYEPPARTREAIARHTTTEAPRSWSPEPAQRKARRRSWVVVLLIVAVIVGVALVVQYSSSKGSNVSSSGFTAPPLALSAASWRAGTREVNCYLSFAQGNIDAEVTGSHAVA